MQMFDDRIITNHKIENIQLDKTKVKKTQLQIKQKFKSTSFESLKFKNNVSNQRIYLSDFTETNNQLHAINSQAKLVATTFAVGSSALNGAQSSIS